MTTAAHLQPAPAPGARPGITYELYVAGVLDDDWSGSLGVDALVRHDSAITPSIALAVSVADQAELRSPGPRP